MLSGIKKFVLPFIVPILCILIGGCASTGDSVPEPVYEEPVLIPETGVIPPQEETVQQEPENPEDDENAVVAKVGSVEITRHEFKQTKSEIEIVVDDLNKITKERNYSKWLTYLDPEYRKTLSGKAYLDRVSKSLPMALQEKNIRLSSLEDYFRYVFVPSRQNIRVDDIQFITPTRVYVIMEISRGQRAAVYILEKSAGGEWRLVGKN